MTILTSALIDLGQIAAESFDDCDTALAHLNDSFGKPYESAKDNLLRDIKLADTAGLDLSVFAGDNSRFKFPQFNTNIVVRITRKPTPHSKLEKLALKVEKLEQELKIAKMQFKHTAEQLVALKDCDETTEKITLAFTRLKKA